MLKSTKWWAVLLGLALAAGPDGLYFSDLYQDLDPPSPIAPGANIWRIRYAPNASTCCAGDFDGNGILQPADVAAFVAAWNTSLLQGTLAGDFDGNGVVQPVDVSAFVIAWNEALGGGC